jgi:putative ABC transport system permease protein
MADTRNASRPQHRAAAATLVADLGLDLRYAARTLRRQPGFSVAVALTLALGLGLNATVLGMTDALLLRPFQFPDYQRLVVVWETPDMTSERQPVAPANYLDWREQTSTIDGLVAWEGWGATLTGRDEPERLQGFRVSPGFFEVLGRHPTVGRALVTGEDRPGRDRVVVIGDGLWTRRFGGRPEALGSEIELDGHAYTIVGIAPPEFDFPVGSQIWAPLAFTPERAADRSNRTLTVLGKLSPGRSLEDARAEMALISERLQQQYPATNRARAASVRTLSTAFREDGSGAFVGILQAAAGFVLLIACANLVGLLLARATDRERELAVRNALGASRTRIARQLVAETVLLGLVASVVAVVIAFAGLNLLRSSMPAEIAIHVEGWNNVRLDWRLIFVIPALATGLGLLVGLIPGVAACRRDLVESLKEGDRGVAGGHRRVRLRHALVTMQIALAFALLVGAGLAVSAGINLANQPGGFDARRLLTFTVPLPEARYAGDDARRQVTRDILDRIVAVPAVHRAAIANVLPAAGWSPSVTLVVEGAAEPEAADRPTAGFRVVSTGYFEALRIPVTAGRPFSPFDRETSEPVAVVSASLAAQLWPGDDPIGRRLRLDGVDRWVTVVGVARDVTMYNWWDGLDFSAVYVPAEQAPPAGDLSVVVRARGEPTALTGPLRAAVATVDSLMAVHGVRTMDAAIAESTFGLRFIGTLMAICGAIALILSFVGIYSMMAYAVSHRVHEFGVRMALGATARDVLRLALRQAAVLTGLGLAIGHVTAVALGLMMSSAVFGLVSLEPTTFLAVTVALGSVACVAAYVPARRTLHLDPASILRAE